VWDKKPNLLKSKVWQLIPLVALLMFSVANVAISSWALLKE